MEVSIDIEDALQAYLNELGHSASARPLPPDFDRHLPHTTVWRTGGTRTSIVRDVHSVSLDVRAATQADAEREADMMTGIITDLRGKRLDGVQVYVPEIETIPYDNPDPEHPDIPRLTLRVQIPTRTKTI